MLDRVVEVHRAPSSAGYREVTRVPQGGRVQLLAFSDVELMVNDFVR